MQTAMQELKEKLQQVVNELSDADQYGYRGAMGNVIKDIDAQMLAAEKQQIYEAFVAGSQRGMKNVPFNCEQYYLQNFGVPV